jgi:hypothetical protein
VLSDLQGRKISTIAEGNFEAGDHSLQLNGSDFRKGIYYVQLLTEHAIKTKKLVIQ